MEVQMTQVECEVGKNQKQIQNLKKDAPGSICPRVKFKPSWGTYINYFSDHAYDF